MPKLALRCFTACLLDDTFTNKLDHFTEYDGDRETKFEIYLYDMCMWVIERQIRKRGGRAGR